MNRDYKALFEAGNKAQLEKLLENGHKRGFDNIDLDYAASRIEDELKELDDVLICFRQTNLEKAIKARKEFADISNFGHMGIFECDKIIRRNR